MSLPKNVKVFLANLEPYVEKTRIENGKVIVTIKEEYWKEPEQFGIMTKEINALKGAFHFEPYVKQVLNSVPEQNWMKLVSIEQQIDVNNLLVDKLRVFLNPELDSQTISESIAWLLGHGWTDAKCQSELRGSSKNNFLSLQGQE